MKIKLKLITLIFFVINGAYGQHSISIEKIEKLEISGFNVQLNPAGNKLLYTARNYKGLRLYNILERKDVEISSENGAGYEPVITDNYVFFKDVKTEHTLKRVDLESANRVSINLSSKDQTPTSFVSCQEKTKEIVDVKTSADLYKIIIDHRDGSQTELAPFGKRNYLNVSLSPDQSKLLFRVSGIGSFVTKLDGSVVKELKGAEFPKWVNNNEVLYSEAIDDGHEYIASELFIENVEDGFKTNLTASSNAVPLYPNIDKTGNKVAFNTPEGDIYVITISRN
jgi:hypothetical protein